VKGGQARNPETLRPLKSKTVIHEVGVGERLFAGRTSPKTLKPLKLLSQMC
jgi:hypothetical protein